MLLLAGFLAGAAAPDTGSRVWRATHGVLLGIARAGLRLVAVGDKGAILLSDDDGVDWTLTESGTDRLLTSVTFSSDRVGWAVGQDATILSTGDAGAHWRVDHALAASDATLFSVAALPAPAHLITTGAYAAALETRDGVHWADLKLPRLDEDYHFNCVVARGGDAVIVGEAGHAFASRAGEWSAMPLPYAGSQFGCLQDSAGRIISFGLSGKIFALPAGQESWTPIETGDGRTLFGGTVLADGRLALVGGGGAVLLVDAAGGRVRRLTAPGGASLSGIAEARNRALIVVGQDGVHVLDPSAAVAGAP